MLPRQHAPQQIGACVAHATESCIPDGGHACGVQEHNDEIEFVALDFMHRGAEPEPDRVVHKPRVIWIVHRVMGNRLPVSVRTHKILRSASKDNTLHCMPET